MYLTLDLHVSLQLPPSPLQLYRGQEVEQSVRSSGASCNLSTGHIAAAAWAFEGELDLQGIGLDRRLFPSGTLGRPLPHVDKLRRGFHRVRFFRGVRRDPLIYVSLEERHCLTWPHVRAAACTDAACQILGLRSGLEQLLPLQICFLFQHAIPPDPLSLHSAPIWRACWRLWTASLTARGAASPPRSSTRSTHRTPTPSTCSSHHSRHTPYPGTTSLYS